MQKEIAAILLDLEAVSLNAEKPFTWVSGIKSPIYCDNRILISYVDARKKIIEGFVSIVGKENIDCDVVAGIATSGIPLAAWLAEALGKPMIYVRKQAKEHGAQKAIEGVLEKGQKVLLVEDLVSTGGSSLAGAEAIRSAGGVVDHCLAIFTYGFSESVEKFSEKKCNLHTLTDFPALVDVAVERGDLAGDMKETVLQWAENPREWNK